MSLGWESAFVAIGAVLGEPVDAMAVALGADVAPLAHELLADLREGSRQARAKALARVLSELAVQVEAAGVV